MVANQRQRHIAYRCPECATANLGLVGKFALHANMLRIKCNCKDNAPSLDISITGDSKIRLSVPCIFCKQNHNYVVSKSIFFDRDLFLLNCPYSGMDIAFLGDKDDIDRELGRTEGELVGIMRALEAEEVSDIQPQDMPDEEILPEPAVYDTVRFIVKDLEAEGKIDCPCHDGKYELRFCDEGIEVFCERCGATYVFRAKSVTMAETYLDTDSIKLS